ERNPACVQLRRGMPCAPPPVSDGRSTSSEISESRQAGQAGFTLLRFSGSICSCSSKRTLKERRSRSNFLTNIGNKSETGASFPWETMNRFAGGRRNGYEACWFLRVTIPARVPPSTLRRCQTSVAVEIVYGNSSIRNGGGVNPFG